MRVLALVTDAYGGDGGIAKFNRDFLASVCAYPPIADVICLPRLMPKEPEPYPRKLRWITTGLGGKLQYIRAVVKEVVASGHIDLIVCGHVNLLPVAFLVRMLTRSPVLLIIHGIDAWRPSRSLVINYLARRIDVLLSVSELTKKRFMDWCRCRSNISYVIPNAVDLKKFHPGPPSAELISRFALGGKTVLMTLGRLDSEGRRKGFDEVITLLPALRMEIRNLVYLIVGDGADRRRLEDKVKSLGLDDIVVFAGFVTEGEKVDYYRLADVFVMPSRGEGFGIVYLEAMACGIPVVASNADGSREAVREGDLGILVEPTDPADIRRGILQALKSPRGVAPAGLDYFSYENFESRLHQIIRQTIGDLAKPPHPASG